MSARSRGTGTTDRAIDLKSLPGWIGTYADKLLDAQGNPERMARVFRRSLVPMVFVDDDRRYLEVNGPGRLALGVGPDEVRKLRIDDVTPPYMWPAMEAGWAHLMETGALAGPYQAESDRSYLGVSFFALANALPGRHLVAFAPAGWPDAGLVNELEDLAAGVHARLTPRELKVLELAADGHNAPAIARELTVGVETVRTHFGHIYAKLGVRDRAAAVAKAMRLGVIA